MTDQALLDFGQPGDDDAPQTISERFDAFHALNPHVYAEMRLLALRYKRAGNSRWSTKGLFELLRYRHGLRTRGEPWRLNNNFTALYARMLMKRERELAGFFVTRTAKADGEAVA